MTTHTWSRWLPASVAALLLAATLTIVGVKVGDAASDQASSLTPIVPCRLADTRADQQVGSRGQPIPANTSVTFAVWGSNGECTIPNTATGIATNVTIVNPTAGSFLTVYPADAATRPKASNLNWLPGAAATPNQVTVGLSANGAINVYNLAGSVDVIIDIVGYYMTLPAPPAPITPAPPTVYQGTQFGGAPVNMALNNSTRYAAGVDVPPGTYLVTYTVTVVNFIAGYADFFRCFVNSGPSTFGALTTEWVSQPNSQVAAMNGTFKLTVTGTPTTNLRIGCAHDSAAPGATPPYMENGIITALQVT